MRKILLVVSALVLIGTLSPAHPAHAVTIIDTGEPIGGSQAAFDSSQWLAAEFTLDQTYVLTAISGFISGGIAGGTGTIAIYSDGGTVPGIEIFSAGVSFLSGTAWQGLSGQTLQLSADTYWVAFEVRAGQTFLGGMRLGPPAPLAEHAFSEALGNPWKPALGLSGIGVRIDANLIPEPSGLLLFSVGMLVVGGKLRRR